MQEIVVRKRRLRLLKKTLVTRMNCVRLEYDLNSSENDNDATEEHMKLRHLHKYVIFNALKRVV